MTDLRVLSPSETADELAALRDLADRGVAEDSNEPFGDQTWVELNAGNAWLITAGQPRLTGASVIVVPEDSGQPALVELVVDPDARGAGLGRSLVDASEALVTQQEVPGMLCTARTPCVVPVA